MKKNSKEIIIPLPILILVIIVLVAVIVGAKATFSSEASGGKESTYDAGSSTVNYYHLDVRIDTNYELDSGKTGVAVIGDINITSDDGGTIYLQMDEDLTEDENSNSGIYEYKSLIGHAQGENLGLVEGDVVTISLVFTYENYTMEIAIDFDLLEEDNLCGGTSGRENYGYDIEIYLQDYIDKAVTEKVETYSYTINYFYNGVQDTTATITGEATENLSIVYTDKIKDGYELDTTSTTTTEMIISATEENVLNIYYISTSAKVVVKYVDQDTGEEIATQVVIEGVVGEEYTTEQKQIEGYTFVESTGNTSGKMTEEDIEVIYYYVETPATVVVKYVDQDTGEEITTQVVIEGVVGEEYTTEQKQIDGYIFVESTENTSGKITEDRIEVIYYYTPIVEIEGTVVVKYIDQDTGKEIATQVVIEGIVGEEYTAEKKEIDGYKYTGSTNNTSGKITEKTIEVIYYYAEVEEKISATVTAKYIDIDTNEEISDEQILNGYVGDSYTTEMKEITYYEFVEVTGNESGKYTNEEIEVTYYYKKVDFNLAINKEITKITVNGVNKSVSNRKLGKIELSAKEISSYAVEVTYTITISNTGKIDGTATVVEYLPKYFQLSDSNPTYWEKDESGNLITDVAVSAGESTTLTVVLTWINGDENFGEIINSIELININNEPGFIEVSSDDNTSDAEIIVTIKTGSSEEVIEQLRKLVTLILIEIMTIFAIICLIKIGNKKKVR